MTDFDDNPTTLDRIIIKLSRADVTATEDDVIGAAIVDAGFDDVTVEEYLRFARGHPTLVAIDKVLKEWATCSGGELLRRYKAASETANDDDNEQPFFDITKITRDDVRDAIAEAGIDEATVTRIPLTAFASRGDYDPKSDPDFASLVDDLAVGQIEPAIVFRKPQEGDDEPACYVAIAGERRRCALQHRLDQGEQDAVDFMLAFVLDLPYALALDVEILTEFGTRTSHAMRRSDMLARLQEDRDWGPQRIAEHIGKSTSVVSNLLKLQKLVPEVKAMVANGTLGQVKARTVADEKSADQVAAAAEALASRVSGTVYRKQQQGGRPGGQGRMIREPTVVGARTAGEKFTKHVNQLLDPRNADALPDIIDRECGTEEQIQRTFGDLNAIVRAAKRLEDALIAAGVPKPKAVRLVASADNCDDADTA